jgi:isocitrate dehydrogenase
VTQAQIVALLGRIAETGMEIVKTENLRNYDGKAGYTLAQGE